jgi:hypothetical protein
MRNAFGYWREQAIGLDFLEVQNREDAEEERRVQAVQEDCTSIR